MPARNVERVTISLTPAIAARLRTLADRKHGGNVSAAAAACIAGEELSQSPHERSHPQATDIYLT